MQFLLPREIFRWALILLSIGVGVLMISHDAVPAKNFVSPEAEIPPLETLHRGSMGWIGQVASGWPGITETSIAVNGCEAVRAKVADPEEWVQLLGPDGRLLVLCGG